ncbi:reverse transcriptase/maturase family protein [Acutalibacter sp. 1XD8-36]|uniref:reverse transcriptase/maturase family protein n=1 Tax=Acutalibacter sp. 1XD8-36 TaxID=2320852 RepID=UPI001411FE34|nr:reverse transcriptase/maturase family protein [Acutalibacter sp. 1XD8-36]
MVCTAKLSAILSKKVYTPSKFEIFKVYEPKERLVQAPAFVDKVVLHAVVDNILYDAICKSFIRDNFASQKQKGTHDGLMRLKYHMVEYYRRNGSADGWVLKCDVRHFFASIDHNKLKAKLRKVFERRVLDMQVYDLLCIYIDASEGLPLGYQTSQLLALLFLDEFDHHIKEVKRYRYYGRYMDDFYIIARTKRELQRLLKEIDEWMDCLGLELNQKTGIFPLRNGIDFLGFHSYLTETGACVQKLRQSNIDRMSSRVKFWRKAYAEGTITKEKTLGKFQAWDAYAAHGDTYALRQKFAGQVKEIIGVMPEVHRKINSTLEARNKRRARQYRNIQRKRGETVSPVPISRSEPFDDDLPPWM